MTTIYTAHITTDAAALPTSQANITVLQNDCECLLNVSGNHLFTASPRYLKTDARRVLRGQGWTVTSPWTATGSGFKATVTTD